LETLEKAVGSLSKYLQEKGWAANHKRSKDLDLLAKFLEVRFKAAISAIAFLYNMSLRDMV